MRGLICGCKYCGCVCKEHSPIGREFRCAQHETTSVLFWLLGDLGAIMALGLLVCCTVVWAGLLA